ncbi:hypothetical protein CONPUDRAFT_121241 [Coniophora puteana RWD-64-598 SS2]|uniref:Uncharacterized protein n=1 Tax=Coniophora puteana (strain RWD-64-598) TaxID=741705 RepID=A0A5M3MW35_CONPW|nr:uncharacterized protein CONPUDRAFT_121241 [Coniophora puteana RWD-64-598 SS2]EIW82944.1 hypothetical protein CONPUDRAFT_121241 [Coniophora puteana RWD-64-598 SS2]
MSYAAAAASNASPLSDQARLSLYTIIHILFSHISHIIQPHPDPALLTTPADVARPSNVADDTAKVNVVSADFKQNPATLTSEALIPEDRDLPNRSRGRRSRPNQRLQEAEAEGIYLWNTFKTYLFQPGVAGGLVGLVNVGLLSSAGYHFYTDPQLRRDSKIISSTIAGAIAILGAEGYAVEKYRQTERGQAEEKRVREEGASIVKDIYGTIARPGVMGGMLGLVNTAILGAVGYYGYTNWDRPRWDRNVVSAISVGLFSLTAVEGYIADSYRKH